MSDEINKKIMLNNLIEALPYHNRYKWCSGGICACTGCINHTILNNNYTKEDWLEWVEQHPYSEDDNMKWLSDFIGTKVENQELQITVNNDSILKLTDRDLEKMTICEHRPNNPVRSFINSIQFKDILRSNIGMINSDDNYGPLMNISQCIDKIITECNALQK